MGAGGSWGKGCCRSQGAPGPCSDVRGAGEGSGGSAATRKGSRALTLCSELTSRNEKPCKGQPVSRAFVGCGAPSPMCWVRREGGSRPSPVESGSDRPEGSRQLSAGGG